MEKDVFVFSTTVLWALTYDSNMNDFFLTKMRSQKTDNKKSTLRMSQHFWDPEKGISRLPLLISRHNRVCKKIFSKSESNFVKWKVLKFLSVWFKSENKECYDHFHKLSPSKNSFGNISIFSINIFVASWFLNIRLHQTMYCQSNKVSLESGM